jgi:hypothetical protein
MGAAASGDEPHPQPQRPVLPYWAALTQAQTKVRLDGADCAPYARRRALFGNRARRHAGWVCVLWNGVCGLNPTERGTLQFGWDGALVARACSGAVHV